MKKIINQKPSVHTQTEVARGAEAVIFDTGDTIRKVRFVKKYRHPELDLKLRRQRTRREASLLLKLEVPHPKFIGKSSDNTIIMEKVNGVKLSQAIDRQPLLAGKVGKLVANLHNLNIIHADLTTSNILVNEASELILIDFGLSYQSHKIEDKAVDIHVFKQALVSKHYNVAINAFSEFLKGYSTAHEFSEVIKRLKEVERRGRYRRG
jgi:bifunctional N6-L-threonylcarbamoyladenine synthase / protein kinase Bud32